MTQQPENLQQTRRRFLRDTAALAGSVALGLSVTPAEATPDTMRAAIKRVVGEGE